ncbi:hypothetical protein [Salmonella enterica]|uniref:Uncharacterized protein n=1 Tax=Salmonella enterica subsp. enterica serovar Karamoja TaxID=2500153 RepID=A0A3T0CIK5_SALET|nr:hypothetical protein EL007_24655 [Salmonella enterica subsp. enterica serovar Karamoja]
MNTGLLFFIPASLLVDACLMSGGLPDANVTGHEILITIGYPQILALSRHTCASWCLFHICCRRFYCRRVHLCHFRFSQFPDLHGWKAARDMIYDTKNKIIHDVISVNNFKIIHSMIIINIALFHCMHEHM